MRLGLLAIVSLFLAAAAGAKPADPDPAPASSPPPSRHLLLVPERAAAELARTDARVVAGYDTFTLVEAEGADEQQLRAAGAQRRDDMREVATAAGAIDPARRPSLAGKQAPDRAEVLALVQFIGPPKAAWLRRLAATGARVVTYQPENAYLVHASGAAVERLAGLVGADPAVRAATAMTAADKVVSQAAGEQSYAVGSVGGPGASVAGLRVRQLRLSPAEVADLAADPDVVVIERKGVRRPHDERTSQIVAGNLLGPALTQPSGPGYLTWHDAYVLPSTFGIDITDSGLDNGVIPQAHPDFSGRVDYMADYTGDADARDCVGHGTNVASIAAGFNSGVGANTVDAGGYRYGLGVAPRVHLGASKIFDCAGFSDPGLNLATLTDNAYGGGARISNNSWGTGGDWTIWSRYNTDSALYDQLVRDASPDLGNQEMVEVFSAGNDGDVGAATISAEATAKNVITVGASEGVRASGTDLCNVTNADADNARQIVGFSSRGPTDDGRLKPDLVAPGTHVTGARPQHVDYNGSGTCGPVFAGLYSIVSGTSQAAPQVSGAAALVRQWYDDNVGPPPSAALTKALLINTATDIVAGPDADQGWGRVNVGTALDATVAREYYDQAELLDEDQLSVRTFEVADPSKPVKVTLAWTDAPGTPPGNAWKNNLDLEVGAAGRFYLGNVFAGSWSRTGGAADVRNNVESVYLRGGTSGRVSVSIRATTVGSDGVPGVGDAMDQDYALVVSNANEVAAAPVLTQEDVTFSGGDGDAALESDEQAQLTAEIRNAGSPSAVTPAATLSGGPGVTVPQPSSSYPTIAGDATAANSAPFTVRLANAATCGVDATASLAVTAGSDTQTVPLALPTGAAGAPQTYAAANTLQAIPDGSAAGVSTSVFVAERGRIKDIDVSIPAITHGWVGDLVIDLTGPDGTRVRLADHPGGPDNDDNDMIGTIFDDDTANPNIGDASAPYSGRVRPQNDQLSRFDGKSRRGTWTLTVRDTFTLDSGTIQGWSLLTSKAVCNVDTVPPQTGIGSGPGSSTTSTSASFALSSSDPGVTFECRIDGAAFAPCGSTVTFNGLARGSHSFNARAIDGSDNADATPAAYTWTVVAPPPPPPPPQPATSFVLAPAEERLADVLDGRYQVLAACAMPCRTSARLTVSARTARRLGLGRRAVTLGRASASRRLPGTAVVKVRLTRAARRALRGRDVTKATLRVTSVVDTDTVTLSRTVTLLRAGGLRRVARRGVRLWAACARACPLSASLTVSAREARRIGLRPGSASRLQVAAGRVSGGRTARLLTATVPRSLRSALSRARRVGTLLEAVAGTAPNPTRTARLNKTLRR